MRGRRSACGGKQHGKEAPGGGARLCFACWRPGSRADGSSTEWMHVGSGPFWADFEEWYTAVGEEWTHKRDLVRDPLRVGECLCHRIDCAHSMYKRYKQHKETDEEGSKSRVLVGQSSLLGRYPSTRSQVRYSSLFYYFAYDVMHVQVKYTKYLIVQQVRSRLLYSFTYYHSSSWPLYITYISYDMIFRDTGYHVIHKIIRYDMLGCEKIIVQQ